MDLQLVLDKRTGDYAIRRGKKPLGILYKKDCEVLGQCWVFDVTALGVFGRDAYFYSSPALAKEWIPREIRNRKQELELYRQTTSVF